MLLDRYGEDTTQISLGNNNHNVLMNFAGIAWKLEKVNPTFSSFNPHPFLPSVGTDDRKQFQCRNIVLN